MIGIDIVSIKRISKIRDKYEDKFSEYKHSDAGKLAYARENGIQGRCYVTFVVEKNGAVSDVKLMRDIGGQCGKESLRVVNLMTKQKIKWTPGKQRGRNVRVQFNLPVHFRLQ